MRTITGKKKKVIGAGRYRSQGDSLPPLAPSSAASRRDDFPQNKGPPVGTPRPQATVAQWAITSPSPRSVADKLTTIASDNELDNDEDKHRSLKPSKRIVSPHPITTNRIINDKKNQLPTSTNGDDNNDYQKPSRQRRQNHFNDDDDDDDDNSPRKSSSVQKSRSRLSDNDDDDDDDVNKTSNGRGSSSARKPTAGASSSRSHSRTNGNMNDDLR